MKYEFVILDSTYKNRPTNLYTDTEGNNCISYRALVRANNMLSFPIAVFINGIMLEPRYYSSSPTEMLITVKEEYPIYPTDRIYIIFTSYSTKNSGYIKEYNAGEFSIVDENTVTLTQPFVTNVNYEVLCVIVNGVVYSQETFTIEDRSTITFTKYRPDTEDVITILFLDKE